MTRLATRPAAECRFDEVSLGEVMLRLDPGEGRIHTARTFRAWEGGGEYNVARGLRRCFGLRTAIVTALADNPVGRLVEDLMLQGGVDLSFLRWVPYDGVGRDRPQRPQLHRARVRPARRRRLLRSRPHRRLADAAPATSTGARSSAATASAGCTPAASSAASPRGRRPSRARRWRRRAATGRASRTTSTTATRSGAPSAARRARARSTARSCRYVDVLFGNEEDFAAALGFDLPGVDAEFKRRCRPPAFAR